MVNDPRSLIGKNIWFLNNLTRTDVFRADSFEFKRLLPVNIIPDNEKYRLGLLTTLLQVRENKQFNEFNLTKEMTQELIDSLC